MARRLGADKIAILSRLSKSGDMVAKAIVESLQDVNLTPGTVSGGVSHVKGQITDGAGAPVAKVQNVLLTVTAAGVCAMTVTTGTVEMGNATDTVWLQTTSTGAFAFDLEDGTPGDLCLLKAETSDGIKTISPVRF